jgi:hypothetical protein
MNPTASPATVYVTPADTAKLIRSALKAAFPGVKFSVRTSIYSGGASINVSWTDGPAESSVDAIAKTYRGADFDGMTDSMNYLARTDAAGNRVRYGANFVFCSRQTSEAAFEAAKADLVARGQFGSVQEIDNLLLRGTFVDAPTVVWTECDGYGDAPVRAWVTMWATHLANS